MNNKNTQKMTKQQNMRKKEESNNSLINPVKKDILKICVSDIAINEVLEYILNFVKNTHKNMYIVTPNPEMIVAANNNSAFTNALNGASLALCDGIGLFVAGWILGKRLNSRIIGTNLVEDLCKKVANQPITVGFFGGKPGVAVSASDCLHSKYKNLTVVFASDEWVDREEGNKEVSGISYIVSSIKKEDKEMSILNTKYQIPNTIDILFVALGHPKQELWMAEHINKIPVRVMIGVGGALDQIVTPSLRPPAFINAIGMGWLYRLVKEPWRWKRQLALVEFVGMVIKEKFG
jgi:N-acetylglucosaminyldiphosphoundecaprenol N-acetyl-beta-D-mannosaminyltransferase